MAVKLVTWNVSGLNNPIKRKLVLDFLKQNNAHSAFLQETHLVGSKTLALRRPWVGWAYHSTYTGYSLGISILEHKKVPFRYLLVHCMIGQVKILLANLYIRPHTLTPALENGPNTVTGRFLSSNAYLRWGL